MYNPNETIQVHANYSNLRTLNHLSPSKLDPTPKKLPRFKPLSHNRIRAKKTYIFSSGKKQKTKIEQTKSLVPLGHTSVDEGKTHHWGIVYEHVHAYTYMYKFKEDFYLWGWRGSWCIWAERGCKGREVAYIKVFLILYGKLVKIACSFTEMPPNDKEKEN